jgi:hypothetical protein
MRRGVGCLFAGLAMFWPTVALAHNSMASNLLPQPTSPVKLSSCYLGTDYMFGDPKLKGEESKMRLSANLAEPVPVAFLELGLRFEFGPVATPTSKIVVFTGSIPDKNRNVMSDPVQLRPSAYLPRVADYDIVRCGVDFATSLDRKTSWYDGLSSVISCTASDKQTSIEYSPVWLSALELRRDAADAVFLMTAEHQTRVSWSLDGGAPRTATADEFDRAIVPISVPPGTYHSLRYGGDATALAQEICFRSFGATS